MALFNRTYVTHAPAARCCARSPPTRLLLIKTVARAAWAFRKLCIIAVGVGVVCATACYMGGQVFSSVVNGLSGTALTLSAMTLPLRRMFSGGDR